MGEALNVLSNFGWKCHLRKSVKIHTFVYTPWQDDFTLQPPHTAWMISRLCNTDPALCTAPQASNLWAKILTASVVAALITAVFSLTTDSSLIDVSPISPVSSSAASFLSMKRAWVFNHGIAAMNKKILEHIWFVFPYPWVFSKSTHVCTPITSFRTMTSIRTMKAWAGFFWLFHKPKLLQSWTRLTSC